MAGNTIILKHAPQDPESALAMEQIFRDAGLPQDAYINIFASNSQVADMIADPRVAGVSVTGSERAGAAVAEVAGRNLKKVVLELGGSDPFIVLDSDDIAKTVKDAVTGRMGNAAEAVDLANSSSFGLGGAVYSADPERAQEVADMLDTGMVWINSPTGSMADLPFGGTKRSGVGRELGSEGINEFVNKKLIYTPAPR